MFILIPITNKQRLFLLIKLIKINTKYYFLLIKNPGVIRKLDEYFIIS